MIPAGVDSYVALISVVMGILPAGSASDDETKPATTSCVPFCLLI